MITSLVAGEPNDHLCSECSIRQLGVCAALDKADLRELAHLSRRFQYSAGETVFAQEEMTTSFYNLLDDTALQAAARWSPADHWICPASRDWRHQSNFSADAVGPGTLCQFSKSAFARSSENKPDLLRRINELAVRELSRAQDQRGPVGEVASADEPSGHR